MRIGDADGGLLERTLSDVFSKRTGPRDHPREDDGWDGHRWQALADGGLAWIGVPDLAGGSGGDTLDACTLLLQAGRFAVRLPLAECALLGGWLVASAGLQLPLGPVSVPVPDRRDFLTLDTRCRVSGYLGRVPWGSRVAAVVALADSPGGQRVVLIDPTQASLTAGRNLAGERRDSLQLHDVLLPSENVGIATFDLDPELALRGGLSRALLMAGAMEAIAELTVEYANHRRQFDRPISAFQAVAQRLVRLSSETEAAAVTAAVAAYRFGQAGIEAAFEVAVAKASASRAASEVATHSHQIHGAIGMTEEYPLHQFTRRLWAWRQEWGSERHWNQVVGRDAVKIGAAGLWARVATGLVEG